MVYIRFWKKIRLRSNLFLNLSKKGISFSIKGKILMITINRKGIRFSKSIKETGVSIVKYKHFHLL